MSYWKWLSHSLSLPSRKHCGLQDKDCDFDSKDRFRRTRERRIQRHLLLGLRGKVHGPAVTAGWVWFWKTAKTTQPQPKPSSVVGGGARTDLQNAGWATAFSCPRHPSFQPSFCPSHAHQATFVWTLRSVAPCSIHAHRLSSDSQAGCPRQYNRPMQPHSVQLAQKALGLAFRTRCSRQECRDM